MTTPFKHTSGPPDKTNLRHDVDPGAEHDLSTFEHIGAVAARVLSRMSPGAELADFIDFGSSQRHGVYLLLWRNTDSGRWTLTRFVEGHEDAGFSFTSLKEAVETAEICNRLGHVDVVWEGIKPSLAVNDGRRCREVQR